MNKDQLVAKMERLSDSIGKLLDMVADALQRCDASKRDACYTPRELSKFLRVRPSKVFEWIRTGRLDAINVGDQKRPRWRIPQHAIQAMQSNRATSPIQAARQRGQKHPVGWVERY